MGRSMGFWAMVVVFAVAGVFLSRLRSEAIDPGHLDRLRTLYNVPEGAVVAELVSRPDGSRRNELAAATFELTPEQYARFVEGLEDPSVWTVQEFVQDRVEVGAAVEPGWAAWHPELEAFLVNLDTSPWGARVRERERALRREPQMFMRWASVSHRRRDGTPAPRGTFRSMCWAFGPIDGVRAVRSCQAYDPTRHPEVYGFAILDDEEHILKVLID